MNQDEIAGFRTQLLIDIRDAIAEEKSGGMREEKFTELALEHLEEAGETGGAVLCREIRENSIGSRIHKINAYALSEGYETVDFFITVFKDEEQLGRLYSEEVKSAFNLSTRFLQNLLTDKMEGIEDTSPVFEFVNTVREIGPQIVRANIYLLSDMLIPVDPPEPSEIRDVRINYFVRDIEYLYRIHSSGTGKQPIEIDFVKTFGKPISCLPMPEKNDDYDTYLCIMPASILADIYKDYGARLLEQNVRTFLQFRGDINKGIRDTILREPHMFMAYNNGISATAESITLTPDQHSIMAVADFQIVNGGQTTASIFQTRRKFKDADISPICVQVKLSVIRDPQKKPQIVSLISKYANTQNKVSEADLSSNHPFHIELEHLSRKTWSPAGEGRNQTRWYYERARGQYNDELSQIDSKALQNKWLARNPKSQKFAKEDLARFYISWERQPWWIVRGRQRGFMEFMKIADSVDVSITFYEDVVAKAILFRTAEKLYGTSAKAIGDLRYMVVPYAMAWLNMATRGRINFLKIWRKQELSPALQETLFKLLKKIDRFMKTTAPGGLIGEWAKKEECWKKLKSTDLDIDLSSLKKDLYTENELKERQNTSILSPSQKKSIEKKIRDTGADGLIRVEVAGRADGSLNIRDSNLIWKIVKKMENEKDFADKELVEIERILQKHQNSRT